jgi:hypothetical protein
MNRLALLLTLPLALAFAGCRVTDAAIDTAKTAAAGNDRYTDLASQAFAGTVDPSLGISPVTSEEFLGSPKSVQVLVQRLLESMHVNRVAWHSVVFQLDEGPDPATMNLQPVSAPAASDDLLDGDD